MSPKLYFYKVGRRREKTRNNLLYRAAELLCAAGHGPLHALDGPFLDGPQILCVTDSPPSCCSGS